MIPYVRCGGTQVVIGLGKPVSRGLRALMRRNLQAGGDV